ncbi:MAG: nucleoside deaminase [Breznakibacter sp.]
MDNRQHDVHMLEAIRLSEEGVLHGGGPFGAVVVKDGKIVGKGYNQVTLANDPTAHAEVTAIRDAAKTLGTFDLSGCTIYTSCEPCPMCLGAIYWARLGKVFYGNNKIDAARIGFDDKFIYEELDRPIAQRAVPMVRLMPEKSARAFEMWGDKADRKEY